MFLIARRWFVLSLVVTAACSSENANPGGPQRPLRTAAQLIADKPAGTNALVVHVVGYGTGLLSAAPDTGFTCSSYDHDGSQLAQLCWEYVPATTTSVSVTSTADASSRFTGWYGPACSGTTGPLCAVPMNTDQIVGTAFEPAPPSSARGPFLLSIQVLGQWPGKITTSPDVGLACQSIDEQTNVAQSCSARVASALPPTQVTIAAGSGDSLHAFGGWGGACTGTTGASCTVTIGQDISITTSFPFVTSAPPGGGAPGTFQIGGTITGLAGSGLVLIASGEPNLTPSAGAGSFAFPLYLASGTPYSVAIAQQPSNPFQTCTLTNGTGVVGSANVSITVACTTTLLQSVTMADVTTSCTGCHGLTVNGNVFRPGGYTVTGRSQSQWLTSVNNMIGLGAVLPAGKTSQDFAAFLAALPTPTAGSSGALYQLGGTISGLSGSGLVLATSGEPNLTVTAGASSFTFATSLAGGTAYAVAVAQQPTNPSQICTVTNGTGVVGSANVTNVAVTCAAAPLTNPVTLADVKTTCTACHGLTVNTTVFKVGGYSVSGRSSAGWVTSLQNMLGANWTPSTPAGATLQDYADFLATVP